MPELPEVEVLVQHLRPLLMGKLVQSVTVFRPRVLRPGSESTLRKALIGTRFRDVRRRGKYLVFELVHSRRRSALTLVGHLGMTGRMFLSRSGDPLPKHTAVVLGLGRHNFIFQDTRYFGRLMLDSRVLTRLGPEPLGRDFSANYLAGGLSKSRQAIKLKLLDQSMVAGIGNIYATEALFRAGILPTVPARSLTKPQVRKLRESIRAVLRDAIRCGSTVPLNYAGVGEPDGLFYFGRQPGVKVTYEERLRVYDRANQPCLVCGKGIERVVQGGRSTFFCPRCQR